MSMCWFITTLAIATFFPPTAYAYDSNPLQDICVAVNDSKASASFYFTYAVFVNGKICKDPKLVKVDDFFASGLNVSGIVVPGFGFFVPGAANFFKNHLFSKILNPGDVFVFPKGLIHFQYNVGHKKATVLVFFNGQNPGLITIPGSILTSEPTVPDNILAKGFQLTRTQISEAPMRSWLILWDQGELISEYTSVLIGLNLGELSDLAFALAASVAAV
ncbi:germin-like protein subfamily 1 member 7 [Lycium barbarum]|uniref:germin-like protein subfamily 1 member 7 n=1 Tax=Lycium barbarum TaxID=112863 RepID=UPI00293F3BE3|nr:germin-like protein subfamily 1 member 7 [Lycium barbarum]